MTLDTFFEKFELLADAPDAVGRMRELVLRLAFQGSLSDRTAADETDETWVAFRADLDAREYSYDPGPPPPHDLPDAWRWCVLDDIAANCGQKAPDSQFTYIDVGSIDNLRGEIRHDAQILDAQSAPSRARKKVERGAVIFSTVRPYLRNVALIERDFDPPAIASTAFAVLCPSTVLDSRFLFFWLRSPAFEAEVSARMKGVAYPAISDRDFWGCPIPLPPLAEQKRIVAKVEELMALCDRLEAQQQERATRHAALARASLARFAEAPTPAHLHLLFHPSYDIPPAELRKAILTLAVQGKLVAQDASDEPVDVLLERNLHERRRLKRTEEREVSPLTPEETLGYEVPESWRWLRLDDLLVLGPTNGFSPKAVEYETPVRSLTLSATTSGVFRGEHSKFIELEVPTDSELWLADGDILVQRGNTIEYVGVPAVYRGEPNQFIYPDLMMKLRVSSAFDPDFIHLAMSEASSREFLRARASGTSGSMPKINQTTLKSLPLPIPPLAEQRRIIAKVGQLMTLVDRLEAQQATSRESAGTLLEAVVGELTAEPLSQS